MLSLLWIALCAFLLHEYRLPVERASCCAVDVVCRGNGAEAVLLRPRGVARHAIDAIRHADGYCFLDGAMRLLDFGAIIAFLGCGYYLLAGTAEQRRTPERPASSSDMPHWRCLFVFLTLEVNSFLYRFMPGSEAGGVSIVWSLFALGLIIAGMWKDSATASLVGLALFAVVAWKVLLLRPRPARSNLPHHRLPAARRAGALRLVCLSEMSPDDCVRSRFGRKGGGDPE